MPHFLKFPSLVKQGALSAALCGLAVWLCAPARAMELKIEASAASCGQATSALPAPAAPAPAQQRLAGSAVARGSKNIAWAWLSSPTVRYPHAALGSHWHAGSLTVVLANPARELSYVLPVTQVFEDLEVRLVDLDGDGRDELVLVQADALRGASLVVLGVSASNTALVELARSPPAGSTFRWLNPVGFADFDGDGKLDVAAVITPHIGGVLTLYHFRPPHLVPYASVMDTSNHRMGEPEQQLAAIVEQEGTPPTIIVPDMSLKALHALRWQKSDPSKTSGVWKELADVMPLPARIERITPLPDGACLRLADGSWQRVLLMGPKK